MVDRRADYALVTFNEHLGPDEEALDVPWAEFVGSRSSEQSFEVSTDDATDAYVEIQAYEVDGYGHEVLVNEEPLTGFDLPPGDGWQYWMDALTGVDLAEGENTLQFQRDAATGDSFVVGTAVVHWREPVE